MVLTKHKWDYTSTLDAQVKELNLYFVSSMCFECQYPS